MRYIRRKQVLFLSLGLMLFLSLCVYGRQLSTEAKKSLTLQKGACYSKKITLQWKADTKKAIYELYKCTEKKGTYRIIQTFTGKKGTITYVDKNVKLGQTYYYKVEKKVNGNKVDKSSVVQAVSVLKKPQGIKVKKVKGPVLHLSWNAVKYASKYEVYRSLSKDKDFKKIGTVKKNSFVDKSVSSGTTYYYKIYACRGKNTKARSKESRVVMAQFIPSSPQLEGSYANEQIKLTWQSVKGADTYHVYRKDSKGEYVRLSVANTLYFIDDNVQKNEIYSYKVQAVYTRNNQTLKSLWKGNDCQILASDIDPSKKMIALTFDDGPGPYTEEIVKCLKDNQARATFFVVGSRVGSYENALLAAYKAGSEIGNHTYSHPTLNSLSSSAVKEQIAKTDAAVKKVTGEVCSLVRTPGGASNDMVKQTVGKPIIYWSIDTRDWATRNTQATIDCVLNEVKDGSIILMHDIHAPTKEAALILIPKLKAMGYQLVTVSELAKYRGVSMKNGTVYYNFYQ